MAWAADMSAYRPNADMLVTSRHFRDAPKPELSRPDAIRLTTKAVSSACGVVDALCPTTRRV
jgi:hypothetical protein